MGSFTEVSLSFYFDPETHDAVLTAFQPMYVPNPPGARQEPAPQLPPFEALAEDGWWEPDWKDRGGDEEDPFADEPWRHDWASYLASSMSVGTVPTAALVWSEIRQWHFSCRTSFKAPPESVLDFMSWLGPFIDASDSERLGLPTFVGTMQGEEPNPYPYLLLCQDKQLSVLDPNVLWDWSAETVSEDE